MGGGEAKAIERDNKSASGGGDGKRERRGGRESGGGGGRGEIEDMGE
jgi:hypothetical protein